MAWCATRRAGRGALAALAALLGGCSVSARDVTVPMAPEVDLPRFMGDWYVIGVIPTWFEQGACNAVESYALDDDGTIQTTFTFNAGALDGPEKRMRPRGFVVPGTNNAVWGMQFVWPIEAEFVIAHVDPAYTETIIARSARDYVWIMARTPTIGEDRYAALVSRVGAMGYDVDRIQRVPQRAGP
ncbi:lipocalin family protein [bacterium]|nr:lipocalin family protein [bacterium]